MPAGDQIDKPVLIGHGQHVIGRCRHVRQLFIASGCGIEGEDFRRGPFIAVGRDTIATENIDFPGNRHGRAGQPTFRHRHRADGLARLRGDYAGISGVAGVFPGLVRLQAVETVQGRTIRTIGNGHRIIGDRFRQGKGRNLGFRFPLRALFTARQSQSGHHHDQYANPVPLHSVSPRFFCCSANTALIGRE